jgi:hypothetical protein
MARVLWHGWASLSLACRVFTEEHESIDVFVANNFVRLEAGSVWLLLRRTPESHVGQRRLTLRAKRRETSSGGRKTPVK